MKSTAVVSIASSFPVSAVHAAGKEEIKIGLIGCGGRGTGAVTQALMGPKTPTRLWAMADVFRDELDNSFNMLANGAEARYDRDKIDSLKHKMDVPESRKFIGFDAYRKLLESGVDMVILACPPHFRPRHFAAAVKAGKHVFMEKPVAVDPQGVRIVIAAAEEAKKKGLSVVAGTQRRHQKHYIEIMNRVHDGDIGEIRAAQCYWNGDYGSSLTRTKPAGMSDMEWQIRNWYQFCWLSGDHIVEQHVHNLDIMNWAFGDVPPLNCMGMGGRAVRQGQGNIYDHFAIEFEYPGGIRMMSMCRQIPGTTPIVAERIIGTKGIAYIDSGTGFIKGEKPYKPGDSPNPYYQEHIDLVGSIVQAKAINEGVQVAQSTLCAVMGRVSAYTGRALKWDWVLKASKLDLSLPKYDFIDLPVEPVAIPGQTPLV
ncbi:MAG: Gfo/Idh/MocA family oxidoreductase [Sedimentisphaerales bacterium]|nr:Gfo/Idh/MocA family oxidoreductase [Sedimentisphaerales bacterium]